MAPGEPGPTPASLLSVYQPYQCRIRNFTIYPLLSRARCRAVSTILFILAAVVAEGWLVSNGSHFPAGHSHTCLQTAVSDPGEEFEISSCQEKLPRSTEASKLPSFMDSSAVAWSQLASFHHGRSRRAITKSQSISTSTRCLVTIGITPLLANYDTNTDVSLDMIFSQIPVQRKLGRNIKTGLFGSSQFQKYNNSSSSSSV